MQEVVVKHTVNHFSSMSIIEVPKPWYLLPVILLGSQVCILGNLTLQWQVVLS